jgi:hypothetical protein
MSVQVQSHVYRLQKLGNRPDENEDAANVVEPPDGRLDELLARYAVADGATTGAFSSEWASELVRAAVAHWTPGGSLDACAEPLRSTWADRFAVLDIPWYAEAKARAGSFATLLNLWIAPPEDDATEGAWDAAAVGDTCLFQVRDDKLYQAFPLKSSSAFDSTPDLIASKPPLGLAIKEERFQGRWQVDDQFYLMSDALAAWFLSAYEQDGRPWVEIAAWREPAVTADRFATWIAELRASHRLRNDDVTLLIIEIIDDNPSPTT